MGGGRQATRGMAHRKWTIDSKCFEAEVKNACRVCCYTFDTFTTQAADIYTSQGKKFPHTARTHTVCVDTNCTMTPHDPENSDT